MNETVTVIDVVAQVTDDTASGAQSAARNVSRLEQSMTKLRSRIDGMKGKSKLEVRAEMRDMATSGIQRIASAGKKLAGKVWTVTLKAKDFVTAPFRKIAGLLSNPIAQAAAFAGVSLGVADTVNTFKSFEQGMANVKAISGATGAEFAELTATAKHLGETTMFSAAQAAGAMENLAMAGWKSRDIVAGMPGLLDLAAAGDVELATAADVTSSALAQFNMAANESTRVADVLAAAATNSKTDVAGLGESLKMAGTQAGALGYSIEDTALALGLMGNAGVDASSAGTALRSTLARMAKQEGLSADETNAVTEAMQKVGVSLTTTEGKSKSLMAVMKELRKGFQGMSETEKAATASNLAGMYAQSGLLAIVNASEEKFNELAAAIENAEGSASRMKDIRMDTLQGSLYYLQSAAEGVKIALGEKLSPYLRRLIDWLTRKMPTIQNAVGGTVDFITAKIDDVSKAVASLTRSPEWKRAETLWDKVELAWDKLIAEPFDEWWSGTGKAWLAEKAQGIGSGIGTALKSGILALLGVDVTGAVGNGMSIGKSFAEGFMDGFDAKAVAKGISEAFKAAAKDAAGVFTGESSSTSGLSAALLGYGALKLGAGKLAVSGAGKLFGITSKWLSNSSIGEGFRLFNTAQQDPRVVGSAAQSALGLAQSGALGFGMRIGATAGRLKNYIMTGTSKIGALGAGSVTAGIGGAVASGASLISALKDVSTAVKTNDIGERGANAHSAMLKGAGVGAGAAIGAGIGALIPIPGIGVGVGALVGAGLGGLVGMYKGNKVKSDYYEKEAARANAPALAAEQAQYKSQELKDALADASVSADDFAKMLEKTVRVDISKHFGKVALSASEIANIAGSITNMGDAEAAESFQNAASSKQSAYQSIGSHAGNLGKLNWKIGLGLALDENERASWEQELNGIYYSVQDYLNNAHYEANTAIKLLVGPDSDFDFTGLDSVYSSLNERLQGLGEQYKGKIELALEDGVITLDEQAEIQNLQDQITAITSKVAEIETTASMKALQIKYSGAALDADSFAALQSELAAQVQNATKTYDDALKVGIQSLELQLGEGVIDQEKYDAQIQALSEQYEAKIHDLQIAVESFQLQSIADAYARDLDGILPDIQGTTAEKLQTAIGNAMASGVDVTAWSAETAAKWLGIESLNKETQTAITGLVSSVAETLPKSMREGITKSFEDAELGESVGSDLSSGIANTNMAKVQSAVDIVREKTKNVFSSTFEKGFDIQTSVRINADYILNDPSIMSKISGSASISGGIAKNANGSIVSGPLLSLVGEDGPEAIIPLSGKYRGRGLDLWEKAGALLGVKQYAEGDIVGYDFPAADPGSSNGTNAVVPVTIENLTFEIRVDGGGKDGQALANEIAKTIREQMPEITNQVAQRIAEALQQIYSNTPKANWKR